MKYRNGKLSLDTKRQKTSRRMKEVRGKKAAESRRERKRKLGERRCREGVFESETKRKKLRSRLWVL